MSDLKILAEWPMSPGIPWAYGVTVTGAPVVADAADPNATPPAASRILHADAAAVGTIYRAGANPRFAFDIVGGTSVGCRPWFFDNTLNLWVKWGPATSSDVPVAWAASVIPLVPGSAWYIQITSVTGVVTAFRYTLN